MKVMLEQISYKEKAREYLERLCEVKPNRRTGSSGNREATDLFARIAGEFGYEIDNSSFECLDYRSGIPSLGFQSKSFEVFTSPYSNSCDLSAELVTVSTLEELENSRCRGKILLLMGALCDEQLMPKNFVFYNPEHHRRIIDLLESKQPAAIITATQKRPEQVGALYPFPLIVDGDFDIPNVYCTDTVGGELLKYADRKFLLAIDSERIPSTACNVIARTKPDAGEKIVLMAHIDAYEDSPGASDNGSGTVVMLLLAEMLAGFRGDIGLEIIAMNGEDHYSAAGQMDYLKRYGDSLGDIVVAINVDDVGYVRGRTGYSLYGCPERMEQVVHRVFKNYEGLVPGDQWYNGDHMIFVQKEVPAIALTAELVSELMTTVTHTEDDTPELVLPSKLVEVATGLSQLTARIASLSA